MNLRVRSKKMLLRLRIKFFPNEHEREVKKYFRDGGDEKFRYEYPLNNDSLVLDFGGFKGQWASDIYSRYNCRILVFEPVKSFAGNISERFKHNSNIEVFSFALGNNRRQDVIALEDNSSSIYIDSGIKEKIQFEDALDFFNNKIFQNVDLMKINIEGGEYELLARLIETGLIKKIKNIQVQFHNYGPDDKMHMENICLELSKTHFATYQYKFVWENWVRIDH